VFRRSHICHCCRLVRRDSSARKSVSEMPLGQLLWSSSAIAGSLLMVEQCASQYCAYTWLEQQHVVAWVDVEAIQLKSKHGRHMKQ
jgi:hypothetical protein